MTDMEANVAEELAEDFSLPVTIGVEAYISEEYARAERDKLWRKVWQQVGRIEEIPEVGSYLTYDILDDSILVVRTAPDKIRAYYNVCSHRGRRLVDTPKGAKGACGKQGHLFVCGFHGWRYNLDGECTHVPNKEDWKAALPDERTRLGEVKVGWVKGLNRLYFLYEAYDNYWDFAEHSRHNDIFEVVVDGDLSGGPLVTSLHPNTKLAGNDAFFQFQGVHAQNYHIFTPAPERDWAFVWGCQPWIKELPWANAAYNYNFKHGESGKLILEFWITPFDYAPFDGPERAVVSKLTENKRIGLSWAVLDYDGPDEKDYKGFWNLSHKTTMYGNADDLVAFRLMPLEAKFLKPIDAHWSYRILDMDRRLLAFQDESTGQITSWRWDFGDGAGSTDRHPIHRYEKAGEYIVNLYIEGPGGKSRWTKVRDVVVR